MYTHIEVEANDNTPMSANLVFKNLSDPVRVVAVRIYDGSPEPVLHRITGWSAARGGSATDAFAVRVEDSGAGGAVLVYGGDWGVRLAPANGEIDWGLQDPQQFGETHLVLADMSDVVTAD
jgi:hypothetical protein